MQESQRVLAGPRAAIRAWNPAQSGAASVSFPEPIRPATRVRPGPARPGHRTRSSRFPSRPVPLPEQPGAPHARITYPYRPSAGGFPHSFPVPATFFRPQVRCAPPETGGIDACAAVDSCLVTRTSPDSLTIRAAAARLIPRTRRSRFGTRLATRVAVEAGSSPRLPVNPGMRAMSRLVTRAGSGSASPSPAGMRSPRHARLFRIRRRKGGSEGVDGGEGVDCGEGVDGGEGGWNALEERDSVSPGREVARSTHRRLSGGTARPRGRRFGIPGEDSAAGRWGINRFRAPAGVSRINVSFAYRAARGHPPPSRPSYHLSSAVPTWLACASGRAPGICIPYDRLPASP